jgi:hypothetical protein
VNIGIDEQKHGNEVADILLAKNIPFAFVTGYNHAPEKRHVHIPLLQKPFNREQLRIQLAALVGPGSTRTTTPRTRPSQARRQLDLASEDSVQPSPRARDS